MKRRKVRKSKSSSEPIRSALNQIVYPTWLTKCDAAEIEEAYRDAIVDSYGDEQGASLAEMAIQELVFPFTAVVLGQCVQVVDASHARYAAFGVDMIVEHGKSRFAISASSVELCDPLPDGHLYLAALLDWHSKL